MEMPDRFIARTFHLDTNRINASGRIESVNRLEGWRETGVILLAMSEVAQGEAAAGNKVDRYKL